MFFLSLSFSTPEDSSCYLFTPLPPFNMPPRLCNGPDEALWEFHKPELIELYSTKEQSMRCVMKHMEEKHGFVAKYVVLHTSFHFC